MPRTKPKSASSDENPTQADKSRPSIPEELVDQLLASVQHPSELLSANGLLHQLMGRVIERSLQTEMTEHLGYEPGERRMGENARNGTTSKTLQTETGPLPIHVPRDREGSFEPQLVKKHQRRLPGLDERILALYARGMSTRDIQDFFQELYGADITAQTVSRVTDAVLEDVEAWRNRRLQELYPLLYLDGLVVPVKSDGLVQNRTVYIALGVNLEGKKEVLGLWMAQNEGAKFWLHVITELHNRGLKDVLIACCDGLKGFPEAIAAVFPKTVVQTCVVHQIRHSLRFVSWTNRKAVARDLRPVYQAATESEAKVALSAFEKTWGEQYPSIGKSWRENWEHLSPFFSFPSYIRKAIYTTNAIESLNRQLRKLLKTKGHFPSEDAVYKLLFLALQQAEKKWTHPIAQWDLALQQFAIHFPQRLHL